MDVSDVMWPEDGKKGKQRSGDRHRKKQEAKWSRVGLTRFQIFGRSNFNKFSQAPLTGPELPKTPPDSPKASRTKWSYVSLVNRPAFPVIFQRIHGTFALNDQYSISSFVKEKANQYWLKPNRGREWSQEGRGGEGRRGGYWLGILKWRIDRGKDEMREREPM